MAGHLHFLDGKEPQRPAGGGRPGLFALAAYAVQATVNLNLPVAMPVTVQLLAMGVSRQLKKKENESI